MIYNQIFEKFRSLDFPKGAIGIGWSRNDITYFCTPAGAEIIGWLGVDGIHFCFIPSLSSDMVFVVSPMSCGQNYVEPVANSFQEFLSLIAFSKDASLLEAISYINEKQFWELLESEALVNNPEKDIALKALKESLNISPNPNTYQHVKTLQAGFDYTTIPFSKEYYITLGIEE